jgi:uncharacterized protein YbjT (DUF2867 family)
MVLVAGATGNLGSEIVRLLRERGESVRGLVRKTSAPETIDRLRSLGAETMVGDLKDKDSLEKACNGARTVISTVSVIVTAQPGDSFADTDQAGTISLIDSAKAAGADHFIFVSFDIGAFPSSPLIEAKQAVEKHLQSSGLAYTILRPGPFMEAWLGPIMLGDPASGQVKVFGGGNGKIPFVSVADVAKVAVDCVDNPSARNRTITFSGPEPVTQREAVRMFEEALGKSLTVTEVPEQALEAQWSSAENPFEKSFAGLMLGYSRLNQTSWNTDERLPISTTVREFTRRVASRE